MLMTKSIAYCLMITPTVSFLATPRAIFPKLNPRYNEISVERAASPVDSADPASFDDWLSQYRDAAATVGVDEVPVVVVEAGLDVDTSFTFSGVIWQVLSDVSTCAFGPGACTIVVHFPGLEKQQRRGSDIVEAFAELFAAAKAEPSGSLVELARLDVQAPPMPGPALIVRATRPRTSDETALAIQRRDASRAASTAEESCVRAVKTFVERMVVNQSSRGAGSGASAEAKTTSTDTATATVASASATPVNKEEVAAAAAGPAAVAVESFGACPYTKSADWAATGLEKQGVEAGPVGYMFEACSDVLDGMAVSWRCFADVVNTPETELSTALLCLPAVAPLSSSGDGSNRRLEDDSRAHARFAAFSDLVSKSLLMCGGDKVLGLVHFHPLYDRNKIYPLQDPSYGHLPPLEWLPAMLTKSGVGNSDDADWLNSDPQRLAASNYQRRAPCLVLNVLRASQLDAATGGLSVVDLEVPILQVNGEDDDDKDGKSSGTEHGINNKVVIAGANAGTSTNQGYKTAPTRTVKASGLRTYSKNAWQLAHTGDGELSRALLTEIDLAAGL